MSYLMKRTCTGYLGQIAYGFRTVSLVEEVQDSPDFWSGPVQSYNSPVEHRFLIGQDRSTNGPLADCDRKYVSVQTMPPQGSSHWLWDT